MFIYWRENDELGIKKKVFRVVQSSELESGAKRRGYEKPKMAEKTKKAEKTKIAQNGFKGQNAGAEKHIVEKS